MEFRVVDLVVLALATWRLSSLFANEQGPFHVFCRVRKLIARVAPGVYEGLECEWCNSVWFGTVLVIAYALFKNWAVWVTLPLALSAVAVVVKHVVQWLHAYKVHLEA